ncbi:hypothetical protein ACFSYD_23335 [Paracoccus aerius]
MTETTIAPEARGPAGRIWDLMGQRPELFTLALIVVTAIAVAIANPEFVAMNNLFDILRASVVRGIFAMGVLVVLAAGASTCPSPPSRPSSCMC